MKQLLKLLLLLILMNQQSLEAQELVKLPITTKQEHNYQSNTYISKESKVLLVDNTSEPKLEVFLANPENNTHKAMIIAPGGALFFNAIDHEGRAVAQKLAENGINAFVLNYRLYPVDGKSEDYINDLVEKEDWEAIIQKAKETLTYALEDAIEAIKHIKNNSKTYSIDPNQIGMMGFSAGGALTLETAFQASQEFKPNFIAPIYPWIDVVSSYAIPTLPIPAFFDCATDDGLDLATKTVDLYKEWMKANQKAELHMHEAGGHGYGMNLVNEVNLWPDLLLDWIKRR